MCSKTISSPRVQPLLEMFGLSDGILSSSLTPRPSTLLDGSLKTPNFLENINCEMTSRAIRLDSVGGSALGKRSRRRKSCTDQLILQLTVYLALC